MPKFDFIIQNPPYAGDTHLKFFEAGLNMLDKDGKMVIIEPAPWLIQLKENGKYTKETSLTVKLKKRIEGHVSKVIIENYTKEFSVGIYSPFSITYIDKSKQYNKILLKRFGEKLTVNSLYDCNIIGSYDLIWSIINKFNCDKINKHLYIPNKSIKEKNKWYCKYATIPASGALMLGTGRYVNNGRWRKILNNEYQLAYLNSIYYAEPGYLPSITIPKRKDHGGNLTDKEADCIVGTKEELENWRHFVFNNSIPLFISICMTIDQNNNSLDYVPWLVDKKYTDEEIYTKFGFTEKEIKLIETTIKKYERYSPWFKRYMCGPSSVSDEEVQKFINELKNA